MGSTGSGSFTDYDHTPKKSNFDQGASSGKDDCGKAFSTSLEEVQNCDFFQINGVVPQIGAQVSVIFSEPRLAIVDNNNVIVGYLPTKYNYLKFCIKDGINYSGLISNSTLVPLPSVSVDISPI
ncbi:hypothetical protein [Flavobacterium anhuiense]|uniref:hypothetical protein n=1 Tax=Flavobacterium anhuiense TaxID=459526 RepID=UPI000E6C8E87|nr:hypothetical protein [Flavobacterium anhuiense]